MVVFTSDWLLPSRWVSVAVTHLRPLRSEYLFTLRLRAALWNRSDMGRTIFKIGAVWHSFALLQNSRQNHCSCVWTKALSVWFSRRRKRHPQRCEVKFHKLLIFKFTLGCVGMNQQFKISTRSDEGQLVRRWFGCYKEVYFIIASQLWGQSGQCVLTFIRWH